MKILHIDTGKEWRGGQRQVFILLKNLLKKTIDTHLLCYENGELYKKTKNILKNIYPLKRKLFSDIKTIRKIIKKIKPDIVHFHDSKSLNYIYFISKDIKKIETRRVSYPISKISSLMKYSLSDYHVAVSNDIEKYLQTMFNNTTTIHSCIELERFLTNNKMSNPFKKIFDKNLLFVGSFSKQKGIEVLIKAMSLVLKKNKNIALHIVGNGELEKKLLSLTKELNISDNIIFYGFQSEVDRFYIHSDICIIPSIDGEGSSGVIKEAMATNNIVIASDLEANKELITNNKNGILFKNKDSKDLAEKIILVLNNKITLDKDYIEKSIKSFSCEQNVKQYIKLYTNLI
jgi:glycosyltransferase involved in cell wall biosynthesis